MKPEIESNVQRLNHRLVQFALRLYM